MISGKDTWFWSGKLRGVSISLVLLLVSAASWAQLEPLTSQYLFNPLVINPALAGNREALSVSILHRDQWRGFEGAPRTETLSMHAPMRKEKVGLGLSVMFDRFGVSSTNLVEGSFAYRIPIREGTLSFGLGAGLVVARNHWNELVAVHPDDPGLPSEAGTYLYPDFSIGANYQNKSFFVALSLPRFLSHKFNTTTHRFELVNNLGNYNYHLQAGYLLRLAENWKVLPSVLIRYAPAAYPQADINAYVIYRDKIWLGASFRTSQSLIGLIMYQLNNQFSLGYSYDMGWGSSGKPQGGTHEIMIRYDFKYLIDVISPRYF